MKVKEVILIAITLTLLLYGLSCTKPASSSPVADIDSLIANLRDSGATVEATGDIEQPFFSVNGKAIKVNGEDAQVFEYQDNASAEKEAALISADGGSIGTSSPFWVAPPHFYKAGKIIVLYVGENTEVISLLEKALGTQFAGR